MSIFKNIYNSVSKFLNPQDKRITSGFFSNSSTFYWGDSFTDELLKIINDCRHLLNEDNPRLYLGFSNLVYKIFPLYKKAIRLRSIFVGTVNIKNNSASQHPRIDQLIKYITEKIPIFDSNTIIPKARGINSLINMISEDCDKFGMSYCQFIYDKNGMINGIQIFQPANFFFSYDENGIKRLYYLNMDTPVDVNSIYVFSYQTIRGYDWGAPLIYGDKFMGDKIIMLISAQINGLMRNMNPFDMTIISTDLEKIAELPPETQEEIKNGILQIKKDILTSSEKSLNGESVHLFSNIPGISSMNNLKANSTITFIDPKTLSIYIELFCAGIDVPFQLMMDTAGSMNTDKYKAALLMMEAWASEYGRPQILPSIQYMITDIFFNNNMPIGENDIEVTLERNEALMQSLNIINSSTSNEPSQR